MTLVDLVLIGMWLLVLGALGWSCRPLPPVPVHTLRFDGPVTLHVTIQDSRATAEQIAELTRQVRTQATTLQTSEQALTEAVGENQPPAT